MRICATESSQNKEEILTEVYKDAYTEAKSIDDVIDELEKEIVNAKQNRVYMRKDFLSSIASAAATLKNLKAMAELNKNI